MSVSQAFRDDSLTIHDGHTWRPRRVDGYLPIEDYAVIGDGLTVALVAADGAIDWLCLPKLDSPSVFGALLDPESGGSFDLAPGDPFGVTRRYVGDTNVLETTFECTSGVVRVTDAMTLRQDSTRELVRRVETLSGSVPLRWSVRPRFGYGLGETTFSAVDRGFVAAGDEGIVAVEAFGGGAPELVGDAVTGVFELELGSRALLVMSFDEREPVIPPRADSERRLDGAVAFWQRWADERTYDGPWKHDVLRSALALKLLVNAGSGAIAAAATTSLPEVPAGDANWDYRFSWVRDASFVADSLLELGCAAETRDLLASVLRAGRKAHPRLQVVYTLDGDPELPERELPLAGYRGARPVRVGNAAALQLQLGIYGDLVEAAWLYVQSGNRLGEDDGRRIGEVAGLVCDQWRLRDSGIWEERGAQRQFTESKLMCWVALDRAARLAADGHVPATPAELALWGRETEVIAEFVERECWSERANAYSRFPGTDELDAAVLLGPIVGYREGGIERLHATIDAVRRELAQGPLVWRYREAGAVGREGAFLACSFWLVSALAAVGRRDEAGELFEELLPLGNDLGLYSEEIDASGALLGNFPQALTHLALIAAAQAVVTGEARI